jgi:hypothetical protein
MQEKNEKSFFDYFARCANRGTLTAKRNFRAKE